MATRMRAEVRDMWADALESGRYSQGVGLLRDADRDEFCCLGVLCEIAVEQGVIPPPVVVEDEGTGRPAYLYGVIDQSRPNAMAASTTGLPWLVAEWAGIVDDRGEDRRHDPILTGPEAYYDEDDNLVDNDGTMVSHQASSWNDEYDATFDKIAKMVRALPDVEGS